MFLQEKGVVQLACQMVAELQYLIALIHSSNRQLAKVLLSDQLLNC
jgi:hypothetical protein